MGALLSEELPLKEMSTQDAYVLCEELDTPRWNRAAGRNKDRRGGALATSSEVADGPGPRSKRVVALFHTPFAGILWSQSDFVGDSSEVEERESKHCVRVSANVKKHPVLSPEQVKLGLTK